MVIFSCVYRKCKLTVLGMLLKFTVTKQTALCNMASSLSPLESSLFSLCNFKRSWGSLA